MDVCESLFSPELIFESDYPCPGTMCESNQNPLIVFEVVWALFYPDQPHQ